MASTELQSYKSTTHTRGTGSTLYIQTCALMHHDLHCRPYYFENQLTLNLHLSVELEVFWNEMSYCFSESVGNATTILRTNSCFNDLIGLTAFPKPVEDVVSSITFEITFLNQRVPRRIDFVRFNGTEYAVGAIGE